MMTLTQFYLTKIAEEASEVAKIALKAQQFGLTETQPGLSQSNAERMYAELNDLNAMILELNNVAFGQFFYEVDHMAMSEKMEKVERYLEYSRSLGLVEGGAPIARWAIPKGWKPAPDTCTPEMRAAGLKACASPFQLHALRNPEIVFRAMLDAAPTPPTPEGQS